MVSYFRVRECHFSFSELFCQQWMFLSKDAANSNIFPPACTLCLVCFYWSSQAVLLFCHISKCDGRLGKSGLGCCFWNTWAAKLGCITFYATLSLCSKLRMWRWCGLWARNCSLLLITHRRASAITSGWRWEILSFNQTVIFQMYLPLCPEEFKCYSAKYLASSLFSFSFFNKSLYLYSSQSRGAWGKDARKRGWKHFFF